MSVSHAIPNINLQVYPSHDVHPIDRVGGGRVSLVSSPAWEDFTHDIGNIDPKADYVLSPDAITVPPGAETHPEAYRSEIEKRTKQMTQASKYIGRATLILGTVIFDHPRDPRPRFAQVFLRGGTEIGRYCQPLPGQPEPADPVVQSAEATRPAPDTAALIWGSRQVYTLTQPDTLPPSIRTILANSTWRLPNVADTSAHQELVLGSLKGSVGTLFAHHPNLQEIIVADRLAPGGQGGRPFNFVATRASAAGH